jgi:sodium/bile acid cotransporter 7
MDDVLLPLILVCLGLALWRGAAWLRLPIDGFILALVLVLLAANLLPCQGEAALSLGLLGKCAVGALSFLQGARLSAQTVLSGVTHWRLHLFVGALTFLVFPLLGLGLLALFPHILPKTMWLGVLFVCALPSTVQSSIALTSMAAATYPPRFARQPYPTWSALY